MLAYWVHNYDPFIIKFPFPFFIEGIRWYGCAYFFGFWVALGLLKLYKKAHVISLTSDQQQSLLFFVLMGILIGGRLGYVLLYEGSYYKQNPAQIFAFWKGGMSSHGGFIGVYIALLVYGKKYAFSVFSLTDLVVSLVPIGLFLGRLANFINAEVVGRITTVPWAVLFPHHAAPRHPSQLYEAVGEGIFLFLWTQISLWVRRSPQRFQGKLTGEFLIFYGIIRIFLECFREPDASLIGSYSRGQFYSIFVLIAGFAFMLYAKKKINKNNVFMA